jgi:hypothetical protein
MSSAARSAEQKNRAVKLAAASTPLDKGSYYEATVSLKDMSDREEAKALVEWVVTECGTLPSLSAGQAKDMAKAKDVLKGW